MHVPGSRQHKKGSGAEFLSMHSLALQAPGVPVMTKKNVSKQHWRVRTVSLVSTHMGGGFTLANISHGLDIKFQLSRARP